MINSAGMISSSLDHQLAGAAVLGAGGLWPQRADSLQVRFFDRLMSQVVRS
jgi:hypothetical protein